MRQSLSLKELRFEKIKIFSIYFLKKKKLKENEIFFEK
jgi:hypothetical protein